jgi:hypothetical protein
MKYKRLKINKVMRFGYIVYFISTEVYVLKKGFVGSLCKVVVFC